MEIREVLSSEYHRLGQLMVDVYTGLGGFPTQDEQPANKRSPDLGFLQQGLSVFGFRLPLEKG